MEALPPPVHDVILTAFRRYDGTNNGNIALTWEDFDGLPGFANRQTFYRHRRRAIESGMLQARTRGNSRDGRKPDLFTIADWCLHDSPVSNLKPCASVEKAHPYIDKQAVDAVAVPLVRSRRKNTKGRMMKPKLPDEVLRALAEAGRGAGWNNRSAAIRRFEIGCYGLRCTLYVVPFRLWAYRSSERLARDCRGEQAQA